MLSLMGFAQHEDFGCSHLWALHGRKFSGPVGFTQHKDFGCSCLWALCGIKVLDALAFGLYTM